MGYYGSYTRDEIFAQLDAIDVELADSRVPDGATGKTRLAFAELRAELRRQRSELISAIAVLDGGRGGLACARSY